MSDPLSDECLYCGSSYVLDDAWFCDRHECWAAYEREGTQATLDKVSGPVSRLKSDVERCNCPDGW